MKISRLLEIIIILMNKENITARDLSQRFEVSVRTIYRDIEILSEAGIPVYMSRGNGGGISLMENYALNRIMVSDQEKESLLLALQTLKATKYPETNAFLDKISALFKNSNSNNDNMPNPGEWIKVDFSYWSSSPNEQNRFIDIKQAIFQHKVIHFDYVNAGGDRSSRFVEPVMLLFKGNAWYLIAYCRLREGFRLFRLSRVKNVIIKNEAYQPRPYLPVEEDMNAGIAMITLKLLFQPKVMNRLYDDFDDALIIRNPDGTLTVTVEFPEDEWVYGYILSYGDAVEVLEPAHIRKIISEKLKMAIKYYGDPIQI